MCKLSVRIKPLLFRHSAFGICLRHCGHFIPQLPPDHTYGLDCLRPSPGTNPCALALHPPLRARGPEPLTPAEHDLLCSPLVTGFARLVSPTTQGPVRIQPGSPRKWEVSQKQNSLTPIALLSIPPPSALSLTPGFATARFGNRGPLRHAPRWILYWVPQYLHLQSWRRVDVASRQRV